VATVAGDGSSGEPIAGLADSCCCNAGELGADEPTSGEAWTTGEAAAELARPMSGELHTGKATASDPKASPAAEPAAGLSGPIAGVPNAGEPEPSSEVPARDEPTWGLYSRAGSAMALGDAVATGDDAAELNCGELAVTGLARADAAGKSLPQRFTTLGFLPYPAAWNAELDMLPGDENAGELCRVKLNAGELRVGGLKAGVAGLTSGGDAAAACCCCCSASAWASLAATMPDERTLASVSVGGLGDQPPPPRGDPTELERLDVLAHEARLTTIGEPLTGTGEAMPESVAGGVRTTILAGTSSSSCSGSGSGFRACACACAWTCCSLASRSRSATRSATVPTPLAPATMPGSAYRLSSARA